MKIDNAVTLLRSLKGAPLSVLIAIRLCPGPASLLQLAAATGYERTAVSQAVTSLEMMGFVERAHYRGWQLTRAAVQLPLWTPCEIGTIAPDACPALGAGVEVDRPPPVDGIRELKAGKNHFQENGCGAVDAPEIPKAGKNHFQGDGPGAGDAPEILKAGKNHFQQDDPEPAEDPGILKAVKNHFQQNAAGDPEILKAVKNHFQQNGSETGDAPEILKAGKNHFQQADPEPAGDAGALKAVKNHFQAPDHAAESLKAGKNHFQPGDDGSRGGSGGSGGSGLINLTTEVKEPPPLLQPQEELKAGKNHFQPAEQENAPPPFDDAEQDLLNDLIDLTGCPRRRAEKAVRTALDEGYYTPWLHLQVLYWHAYLHDDRGTNLKNPGYFVAKKLENGEACPFDKARTCHREKTDDLLYAWRRQRDETTN